MNKVQSRFTEGQKAFGCDSTYFIITLCIFLNFLFGLTLICYYSKAEEIKRVTECPSGPLLSSLCGVVDVYFRISRDSNSAWGTKPPYYVVPHTYAPHTATLKRLEGKQ